MDVVEPKCNLTPKAVQILNTYTIEKFLHKSFQTQNSLKKNENENCF